MKSLHLDKSIYIGVGIIMGTISFGEDVSPESEIINLPEVSVIAHSVGSPLNVDLDPKAPIQPMPVNDGAEILRSIPGFNIIRKGGTSGDPVLRGMAGSRLGIVVDGETLLGGCGMRMDPPTAYVFPTSFDKVSLLKGPQSVLYGPGNSAGVIRFEREINHYTSSDYQIDGGLVIGSFGRRDMTVDIRGGNPDGQFHLVGTASQMNDYKDGDGREISSAYERRSLSLSTGWTPDDTTLIELSGAISEAEAAYADRAMDGTVFDRENIGFRYQKSFKEGVLRKIEAKSYFNAIDHVMDNYSLRIFTPSMMMPNPMVSNPTRETWGGWIRTDLEFSDRLKLEGGIDYQRNDHTVRNSMNQEAMPYQGMPRLKDAVFENFGVFGEIRWSLRPMHQLVAGARMDFASASDYRPTVRVGMMNLVNPTFGYERENSLPSAFVRYELELKNQTKVYLGIGHSRRFPDYWEFVSKEGVASLSAFELKEERTHQIDFGMAKRIGKATVNLSLFYNEINDYVLIEYDFQKSMGLGSRNATVSRSIDARTWGGEGTFSYTFSKDWFAEASISWVHGDNLTDHLPLAQQPPLEGRVSLKYQKEWGSIGVLWRGVASQDRFAPGQGNIVGQDFGPTSGFGTLAINASMKLGNWGVLTAGIDNVLDKTYAEHLSRAGAQVAGFPPPTLRLNEPGRMIWLALNLFRN